MASGVDYTVPLHVDCSVEYELPAHAKPPPGVRSEPLLMIHPCHLRRPDHQRCRPYAQRRRVYDRPWPHHHHHHPQQHYQPLHYELAYYNHNRTRLHPYAVAAAGYNFVQ